MLDIFDGTYLSTTDAMADLKEFHISSTDSVDSCINLEAKQLRWFLIPSTSLFFQRNIFLRGNLVRTGWMAVSSNTISWSLLRPMGVYTSPCSLGGT